MRIVQSDEPRHSAISSWEKDVIMKSPETIAVELRHECLSPSSPWTVWVERESPTLVNDSGASWVCSNRPLTHHNNRLRLGANCGTKA